MTGLKFDPGFAPYILAFQGTVEYLYTDINRFKNLSQKKMKFKQYYKKILDIFYNNIGFYIGCLMWAAYIKTQDKQEIINNYCLGHKYNEEDNTAETDFMIKFTELFPKDMKYFLGQSFEFDNNINRILSTYKEFLVINRGFVDSKYNTDIRLPKNINTKDATSYKEKIDEILQTGNLSKFMQHADTILA